MLRALWFFLQLAVVVCAAIWISTQKGAVDIEWNDYSISLHLGLFLLALTLFTIIAVAFFRIVGAVVNMPSGMSRRRRERNRKKGFQALTRGFVAIAAGDTKKASALAREVRTLMPDETGLPLLLEAQAARMRGEEGAARQSFEKLLSDKDAGFLGVKGLLKSSLDQGDSRKALEYARTALHQNPKQPWILKSVYDLELQNHLWQDAHRTLDQLKRYKAIDPQQATGDEIAFLMIEAEREHLLRNQSAWLRLVERAVKLNPAFTPTVVKLGEHYLVAGKHGKAASIVEKAWKSNPHPDLAVLWDRLAPEAKASDPLRRLRWFEKLVSFRPDSAEGQLAAAKVAMESGLNGEARTYLQAAEAKGMTSRTYRLRADLEEVTTRSPALVREWLDKASQAEPDPVWYCSLTGTIYSRWAPVAEPHGSFNTIRWGNPLTAAYAPGTQPLKDWKDPLLIENV